jgi:hypothetical protein
MYLLLHITRFRHLHIHRLEILISQRIEYRDLLSMLLQLLFLHVLFLHIPSSRHLHIHRLGILISPLIGYRDLLSMLLHIPRFYHRGYQALRPRYSQALKSLLLKLRLFYTTYIYLSCIFSLLDMFYL